MRAIMAATLILAAACGPRQVEVRTAPTSDAEVSIDFTNNLSRAVNVYVNRGGSDLFVRQVPANTVQHLPVQGISPGTEVTLKATTIDGAQTYTRAGVVLSGTVSWRVP